MKNELQRNEKWIFNDTVHAEDKQKICRTGHWRALRNIINSLNSVVTKCGVM